MNEPTPRACNREAARRYLGCTESRFTTLLQAGVIKSLGRDWYSYQLLDEAMEYLERLARASKQNVITIDEGTSEETGSLGSKGVRRDYGEAQKLLRNNG